MANTGDLRMSDADESPNNGDTVGLGIFTPFVFIRDLERFDGAAWKALTANFIENGVVTYSGDISLTGIITNSLGGVLACNVGGVNVGPFTVYNEIHVYTITIIADVKFSTGDTHSISLSLPIDDPNTSTDTYSFKITTGPGYQATNPGPEDDEIDVNRATNLTWDKNGTTVLQDVWFGPVDNMVLVALLDTEEVFSIQNYINEGVDPEDPTVYLDLDAEYEWRVDSYTDEDIKTNGDIWNYTTRAQRTVILSAPDNEDTGLLLPPFLIEWTIDGIGAQYGSFEDQDFLFIYMRKDDANFTEDNLIGNFVQAVANDDLQIVALTPPMHGSTYYWQIQAGNTAADLADSEVWSFTILNLLPPAVPIGGNGEPIGINNMLTRKRFIAAANNKIWYEDI